jgi:hypothetical protein
MDKLSGAEGFYVVLEGATRFLRSGEIAHSASVG